MANRLAGMVGFGGVWGCPPILTIHIILFLGFLRMGMGLGCMYSWGCSGELVPALNAVRGAYRCVTLAQNRKMKRRRRNQPSIAIY